MDPAILLLAAIPAAIWAGWFVFRGSLLAGAAALVVVMNCFGFWFMKIPLGSTTLTLDRICLLALLAAAAGQWLVGKFKPLPMPRLEWAALALFLALLVFSTYTHDRSKFVRPDDPSPTWRLVAGYLMPLCVFLLARSGPLTPRALRGLLIGMFAYGVYFAATGILEHFQAWSLVFPKYIADPKAGMHFGRSRGPLVHAPAFGLYLAVLLYAGLLLVPRSGRWWRLAVCAAAPLSLAAIYFTLTRMVWIGAALGLLGLLALSLPRMWRGPVVGGLMFAGIVVGAVHYETILSFKRETSAAETRDSAQMRAVFAYVSWQMFLDRPLLGAGFGQFPKAKLPYLNDRSVDLRLESIRSTVHHNTYLSLLVEVGAIGLALYLAVLGRFAANAWLVYRSPHAPPWAYECAVLFLATLGVYGIQALLRECSYSPNEHSLVFGLAGIVSGLAAQLRTQPPRTPAPHEGHERPNRAFSAVG